MVLDGNNVFRWSTIPRKEFIIIIINKCPGSRKSDSTFSASPFETHGRVSSLTQKMGPGSQVLGSTKCPGSQVPLFTYVSYSCGIKRYQVLGISTMYMYIIIMWLLRYYYFYLGFLSRIFTDHRTAVEGGWHFFNSSLSLPPASQTLRY